MRNQRSGRTVDDATLDVGVASPRTGPVPPSRPRAPPLTPDCLPAPVMQRRPRSSARRDSGQVRGRRNPPASSPKSQGLARDPAVGVVQCENGDSAVGRIEEDLVAVHVRKWRSQLRPERIGRRAQMDPLVEGSTSLPSPSSSLPVPRPSSNGPLGQEDVDRNRRRRHRARNELIDAVFAAVGVDLQHRTAAQGVGGTPSGQSPYSRWCCSRHPSRRRPMGLTSSCPTLDDEPDP